MYGYNSGLRGRRLLTIPINVLDIAAGLWKMLSRIISTTLKEKGIRLNDFALY